MSAIGDLAGRLRSTLHLQEVRQHLSRGSAPDRVRVDFEVVRKDYAFDLSVPRFLYDSNQGWTAGINASGRYRAQSITVGLGSNGDDLTERFTGFSTRYEDAHVFSDRVRFAIDIEGYHDLWNPATRLAAASAQNTTNASGPGASNEFALYRTRRNIAPALTFMLSKAFSVSVGTSFERMEMEAPSAAGNDMSNSANAVTAEVNFGYTDEDGDTVQRWDGRYGVRIATRQLGSDYVYSRHNVSMRYEWRAGRHLVVERLAGGAITGQAPLFERFVLGNSSTLQGWDHYTLDPLGSNRMVHNSLSYGYQLRNGAPEVFYDAGLVGNSNAGNGDRFGTLRHSLGVGFRQGIFNVAAAFPLCQGRFEAVFMAGMNY
jgi:outer membrane protein assembly factor BamA